MMDYSQNFFDFALDGLLLNGSSFSINYNLYNFDQKSKTIAHYFTCQLE